jgi:cobalt-precorrin 5A hydrolase
MRRVVILSYTERGGQLNKRLQDFFLENGDVAVSYALDNGVMSTKEDCGKKEVMSTKDILRQEWHCADALLFVGALGIAVRHVAPFLESKVYDPAVLVLDEKGEFVIPVVSGHIGGGVALAKEVARDLGAEPVITTATDVQGRFAVDVFAVQNHLWIENPESIKLISRTLLQGGTIDVRTDMPVTGDVPQALRVMERNGSGQAAIIIGQSDEARQSISSHYGKSNICVLSPRPYILGVGCKKGKSAEELYEFFMQLCADEKINPHEIAAITSIDIKKEEPGLWNLSRRLRAEFAVFDAAALAQVEETVQGSSFVRDTVGVDNVCERSAYCLAKRWTEQTVPTQPEIAGRGAAQTQPENAGRQERRYSLRVGKQAQNGMTMALVKYVPTYRW